MKKGFICWFTVNNKKMIQNLLKKSAALKIGIPRKGFNIRRSLSPVIMQDALADTANSRNLLSLGSRQSVITISTSINAAFARNSFMAESLLLSDKYFSNFNRTKVSANSSKVVTEYITISVSKAILYACLLFESARIYALIRVLVSQIKSLAAVSQKIIEDFFRKSFSFRFSTKVIQKFFMVAGSNIVNHFFQSDRDQFIKAIFRFRTKFSEL